jgi:hypothetical protein
LQPAPEAQERSLGEFSHYSGSDALLKEERVTQVDQDAVVYEPPMLAEVGDFAELTRGSGFDALDSVDYYAGLT